MGVYIKGMKMPRYCDECKLLYDCAYCIALEKTTDWKTSHKRRRDDCPLVEVKALHGRLIDADALRREMYHKAFETDSDMQKWESGCWIRYMMFEQIEEAAPTVIEAEGDDGTQD